MFFHIKAKRNIMIVSGAVLLGIAVVSPVFSQPQSLAAGISAQEGFYNADLIAAHYQNRSMRTIWVRGSGTFQPRVSEVLNILEDSWTHGLNPAHYRVKKIGELVRNLNMANKLELDMLISDSVVRYMRDLTSMRAQSGLGGNARFWRASLTPEEILEKLDGSANPVSQVRNIEPKYALYQSLRSELIRLAEMREENEAKISSGQLMRPGRSYSQIPALRKRLGLEDAKNPNFYDEPLAVAVMNLQRDYNLETDGVIGPKTLELINITREDKMMQIIANMERLRWMNEGRPDRYVLVNIPSAHLWAVDDGEVALEMPVIVGKTGRPTYSFKTEITGVRMNPNWTVPPTIKRQDFLPMLQQDPYVLTHRGIRIFYQGREIDPGAVDWAGISSRELGQLRMTQSPGDENPLGKVRVIMDNPYDIYLHDTNNRKQFSLPERELSSGCIRVAEPEKLAEFILGKNEGWKEGRTKTLIGSNRMRDITVDEPIPVFITYQTVWLDADGDLVYGRDPYGQDKKMTDILKKSGSIHIPQTLEKDEISL